MTSSIGSVVGGLLGGAAGSNGASLPNYYGAAGQNSKTYNNLLDNTVSNNNQLQSTAVPAAFNNYATASNNPFASAFQTGAGNAGTAYTNAGTNATSYGNVIGGQVNPLMQYAQQIMQMGMDPNKTLYNTGKQGVTDTANATNASYGLTGPWAAGNTNQAQQTFDSNWQTQQLQRAISALGAGSSADTAAGQLGTTAAGLQTGGAADMYQGAGLPYNTAQGISNNQNVNLNDLITNIGSINGIDQNTMASILQYLQGATGQSVSNANAKSAGAASGASGGMDLGNLAGTALSMAFL